MRATRRTVVTAAVVALVGTSLVGCSTSSPEAAAPAVVQYFADYPSYGTEAELVQASDVVVRGTVLSTRVEQQLPEASTSTDPRSNPQAGLDPAAAAEVLPVVVTVSTLVVEEVLKGSVAVGSTVEVSQLGGRLGGVAYVAEGTVPLKAGTTDYVLLLADHGAGVPLDLVNPQQAMYTVSPSAGLQPVTSEPGLALASSIGQIEGLATK
jgi:hypothetical protein